MIVRWCSWLECSECVAKWLVCLFLVRWCQSARAGGKQFLQPKPKETLTHSQTPRAFHYPAYNTYCSTLTIAPLGTLVIYTTLRYFPQRRGRISSPAFSTSNRQITDVLKVGCSLSDNIDRQYTLSLALHRSWSQQRSHQALCLILGIL